MNREGHNEVNFFVGPEVEHTPAFSKKTLFVVGKQKLEDIQKLAREHKTPHIFMGANHSFSSESQDLYWDIVITALLDTGYWVTLDYQAHEHNEVLKMLNPGIWQSRTFVPLLGVRIPKIQTSSPNLTVKIDDIDFKATNPGVWCLHFHEVTDSNRFTDWQDYGTDEVITVEEKVTPMPPYVRVPDPLLEVNVKSLKDLKPAVIKKSNPDIKNDASVGLDPDSSSQLKNEIADKPKETVYADFDPPKVDLKKLKEKFDTSVEKTTSESLDELSTETNDEVKNDQSIGLDTSKKPVTEESTESKEVTLDDAVAAYADTETSAKKKGKK